jgi:Right handed beta helix region
MRLKRLVMAIGLVSCANAGQSTSAEPSNEGKATDVVASPSELISALSGAKPASTITLQPGIYPQVVIKNFSGHVTIRSAIPAHPAVIGNLVVESSSGLTFQDLEFSTKSDPIGPNGAAGTTNFSVITSSDIHFIRLSVHGDPAGNLTTAESGFLIRSSHDVSITDSDFSYLHFAVAHFESDHITFSRNNFHNLRDDGIRGGGSSWVKIDYNHCWSNHPDQSDTDHPDCIQFWTSNTKASAHDITISNNTYERGSGLQSQGIFMRDEKEEFPYRNVAITNNVIKGAGWNGIAVMHADGLRIEGNDVIPGCDMNSWIRVQQARDAVVTNNYAGGYVLNNNDHLVQNDNRVSKCQNPK